MWIVRIRLSFVFLCCCLSLSVAQALTSTQAIGMVQGETDNRLEILNQALQEADAATANYLQALADDAVKVAGKQVLVLRDGKAFDPVTAAEIPMPAEAEDVVSNNRMRGEIDAALAALKLLNPDDKVRLQAAMALAKEPDAAKLPLINKALKVEPNAQVKNALMLAKAAMAISATDAVERLQAAQILGQAKSPEAQLLLNQQLGVETDVKVKAQIMCAGTPRSMSRAIRWVMTRVLPEPAPASTSNGPSVVSTASRCGGLRCDRSTAGCSYHQRRTVSHSRGRCPGPSSWRG
jgi:urea transport system permease protein